MKVEVIRTDGTREEHTIHAKGAGARLAACHRLVNAETFDFVNLHDGRVMGVDDDGWECEMVNHGNGHIEMVPIRPRKPINEEATKIYHKVCIPGTTHQIVGDVVIAYDEDFE